MVDKKDVSNGYGHNFVKGMQVIVMMVRVIQHLDRVCHMLGWNGVQCEKEINGNDSNEDGLRNLTDTEKLYS